MEFNFYNNYKQNGFAISEPILDSLKISKLRSDIENELKKYEHGVQIGIEEIKNYQLLEDIINIFNSDIVINKIENINKKLEEKIFLLPRFQIHKNYHVNLRMSHGWHRDCGGEMQYEYCKNILYSKKYFFSKIGIYLQPNTDFGGSIDIINNSHNNFSKQRVLIRKFKNIPLRIVTIIHKYFNYIYQLIPEKIFMFFLNAKKLLPKESSAVFFDSRLIHRGSPISKKNLRFIEYKKNQYRAKLPIEKNKFSLYCHVASQSSLDSYFYDRLKRKNNFGELKVWIKQIDMISKIDKELANNINEIFRPIKEKYTA